MRMLTKLAVSMHFNHRKNNLLIKSCLLEATNKSKMSKALMAKSLLKCPSLSKEIRPSKEFLTRKRSLNRSKLSKNKDILYKIKTSKWKRIKMVRILKTLIMALKKVRKKNKKRSLWWSKWMRWGKFHAGSLLGKDSKISNHLSMEFSSFLMIVRTTTFWRLTLVKCRTTLLSLTMQN